MESKVYSFAVFNVAPINNLRPSYKFLLTFAGLIHDNFISLPNAHVNPVGKSAEEGPTVSFLNLTTCSMLFSALSNALILTSNSLYTPSTVSAPSIAFVILIGDPVAVVHVIPLL